MKQLTPRVNGKLQPILKAQHVEVAPKDLLATTADVEGIREVHRLLQRHSSVDELAVFD